MKTHLYLIPTILVIFVCLSSSAQELSPEMKELEDICIALSDGLKARSDFNIRSANSSFRKFLIKHKVGTLKAKDMNPEESPESDGSRNVVFLPEFFDSLLVGDRAYMYGDSLKRAFEKRTTPQPKRGGQSRYGFLMKNITLPPLAEVSFIIEDAKPHFEIFAVAQPYGAFTMFYENTSTHARWHDITQETEGDYHRERSFDNKQACTFRIRIVNRIPQSYSVVVFTN